MRPLLDTDALLRLLPGLPAVPAEAGVRRLGIEDEQLRRPESLPWHHRDPFDRLLVARARAEALTVLTADPASGDHAVPADPTVLPSAR